MKKKIFSLMLLVIMIHTMLPTGLMLASAETANTDYVAIYEETLQYMETLPVPDVGSVGGEWMVICLTRAGRECPDGYYENVIRYVSENINDKMQLHRAKSTDNSRVILALTSAGFDVTDVNGYDLLKGLSDMDYLKKQGVNGPIWALIAFDSYDYEIPLNENEETQTTREKIIEYILDKQLPDGGWSIFGNTADPDMTAMAIQSLAPYCQENPDVNNAVENALNCLSYMQREDGGFGSVEGICSESCAQIIVALTSLGIDPETDERFIKNGISVVDALCTFAIEGGGFEHVSGSGLNGMATEQSQYALTSYFRFLNGEPSLYDMTDVTIANGEDTVEEEIEEFENYEETYYTYDEESYYEEQCEESLVLTEEIEIEESKPKIIFTKNTFYDVREGIWYYEAIKYVYENSIMDGIGNAFDPDNKMTRAMLVTVLYRMANSENVENKHNFIDVADDKWYSDAVSWASEYGIVSGVSEDKFMPDEYITREQMALIIYRFAKMQGIDTTSTSNLEKFVDAESVSDWAIDAVKWANSVKLINGTSDTTLSPKDTSTRAQVAAILMRYSENLANSER